MVTTIGGEEVHLGMVADGHGGSAAAELCKKHLLQWIVDRATNGSGSELSRAAREAFASAHAKACAECGTAGTTITVVAINTSRGEVTTMNCGDSNSILVPFGKKPIQLSEDHRLATVRLHSSQPPAPAS